MEWECEAVWKHISYCLFAFQIIECKNIILVIRLSFEVFVTNPTNYWGWLINLLYIISFVETNNYKKVLKSRKHQVTKTKKMCNDANHEKNVNWKK